MAYNPPVSDRGLPLRVDGEYLLLERKNMEVEFRVAGWKKKTGKGHLYLSNARMVFISKDFKKEGHEFKSFDIPLDLIRGFKFE